MFCVDPETAKANEARRLATIADYEIEADSSEPEFEHIVELAAAMFGVPISLISIVEQERQFFAARVGLEASSTARDISFCTHALERDEALVVEDALLDPRFADNPLVLGPPYIRFYAGAPLRVASGDVLGTLCIISPEPRKFEPELARILESLARIVVDRLELRRSERRRRDNEERLVHLAHVDQLTGLPNRALFQERATAMLKTVRGRAPGGALLLFDLDGFKDVNDVLGHVIGDRLLAAVGERLSKCTEAGQLLARLGGDEFVLLVPGVGDPRAAHRIATDMCDCFRDPFKVDGEELQLDTSIGIAIAPHHGTSVEGLLVSADLALYHAKDQGGGSIGFFEPHLRHQVEARQRMQGELRHAFECGEFELLFQPQVSLPDRRIVGAEALLRWRHPVHGLLAPVQFLAVLERMPLSIKVGSWVVRTAIAQAAAWLAIGHPLRVGINLFAAQFRPGNLAELVRGELARHGLPGRLIEIEVTESTAIKDSERVIAELAALRQQGVGIALDDFGTGYASLSLLKEMPLSRLKIDKGFVREMVPESCDAAVVDAVLRMGNAFKLGVIAEGVETAEQEQWLIDAGCAEIQGYLHGRPMEANELTALIEQTPLSFDETIIPSPHAVGL